MTYVADKRIYCNREHTEIVPEDNPDGAILLVPEGGILTDADAASWGLAGKASDASAAKPSPELAFAHAQGLPREDTSTKSVKGSKNKAQQSPDADKAEDSNVLSEDSFSASQPQNAVSGADAPAPDIQALPKTENHPEGN